jgi:hypothetical protein
MKRTGLVIFHAPSGSSAVEKVIESARRATTFDLIQSTRGLVPLVVAVSSGEALQAFRSLDIEAVPSNADESFHFGRTLQQVIDRFDLESAIYFGSGSGAFLSSKQLGELVRFSQREDTAALFNNFYSCDFAVLSGASKLHSLLLPETDNGLGFMLADAGIPCYSLPRSLESQFDIDTPIDLLLAQRTARSGATLRRVLDRLPWEHPTLDRVSQVLCKRTALVYLIGRVSPTTWQSFEQQVACRTAGLVEGRGMKAYSDRQSPAIASFFRRRGFGELFDALQGAADAAIIDSRPLLTKDGFPSPSDRFSSDLFRSSEIEDPLWREFTERAAACSIPILLGGHALVSGGLYLLSEICWKGRNLPRRLHPDPYEGDGIQYEPVRGQTPD